MRPLVWSSVNHFRLHLKQLNNLSSFFGIYSPKPINMQKLVILACLIAFSAVASGQLLGLGLGLGGPGYGYIGGLTKLPNLGFGNIASVNSNQNIHGFQLRQIETGPLSVRTHVESKVAPLGLGIPVGLGYGGIIG